MEASLKAGGQGLGHGAGVALLDELLRPVDGAQEGLDRLAVLLERGAGHLVAGVGHLARQRPDGGEDIAFALLLDLVAVGSNRVV